MDIRVIERQERFGIHKDRTTAIWLELALHCFPRAHSFSTCLAIGGVFLQTPMAQNDLLVSPKSTPHHTYPTCLFTLFLLSPNQKPPCLKESAPHAIRHFLKTASYKLANKPMPAPASNPWAPPGTPRSTTIRLSPPTPFRT